MNKITKILFFRIKTRFFYIWGCCDKKCILQNVYDFTRGFFLYTWLILSQHPQQVFCFFNNIFWGYLANQLFFSIFWVFMHHPSKFGSFSLKIDQEINFQSWPFQTLFWQLNHSAMVDNIDPAAAHQKTSLNVIENFQHYSTNIQPI